MVCKCTTQWRDLNAWHGRLVVLRMRCHLDQTTFAAVSNMQVSVRINRDRQPCTAPCMLIDVFRSELRRLWRANLFEETSVDCGAEAQVGGLSPLELEERGGASLATDNHPSMYTKQFATSPSPRFPSTLLTHLRPQ